MKVNNGKLTVTGPIVSKLIEVGEEGIKFDPYKVERLFSKTGIDELDEYTCVSSSDYDKLLAMYDRVYWRLRIEQSYAGNPPKY